MLYAYLDFPFLVVDTVTNKIKSAPVRHCHRDHLISTMASGPGQTLVDLVDHLRQMESSFTSILFEAALKLASVADTRYGAFRSVMRKVISHTDRHSNTESSTYEELMCSNSSDTKFKPSSSKLKKTLHQKSYPTW